MSDRTAHEDDAADLLKVVKDSSTSVREALTPGVPELTLLLAAWSLGRLTTYSDQGGFTKVFLVVAVLWYPLDALSRARARRTLGGDISVFTWAIAAAVLVSTLLGGVLLDGSASKIVVSAAFGAGCFLVGARYRSVILLVIGGAMLTGEATQSFSNWIVVSLMTAYVVVALFFGRKQLVDNDA